MKILVVDDHPDVVESVRGVLENDTVLGAADSRKAIVLLDKNPDISLALIDVRLGNEDGVEFLKIVREKYPMMECVMISGYSDVGKAVAATKLGAFDFLEKPLSFQKLKVTLQNAAERYNYHRLLHKEIERYRIIGESSSAQSLNRIIDKASASEFPILIHGESGSGKEHVAHLIHLKSKRGSVEMVKLNCAAIPHELFESELFGHEKGAFTGASVRRIGKLEQADRGTLFLDEIGEMLPIQQAKLLRALEEKRFVRIGSNDSIPSDFRLISATNRDLQSEVEAGKFREDFYYRINVIVINVPSLSERREDIPILARHFIEAINQENGLDLQAADSLLEALANHEFPGNVRELKNLIQRMAAFADNPVLNTDNLSAILKGKKLKPEASAGIEIFEKTRPFQEAKAELERLYIETQLAKHDGNISHTALALDMLPNNLTRKMKTLGMK